MTTEEKLLKLRKLADAMYYAAQHLTTDASRLHKAMDEYHKFIIHECKEEPVSKDLKEAYESYTDSRLILLRPDIADMSCDKNTKMSFDVFDGSELEAAFYEGANWQKEQFEKNRLKHCDSITNEEAELEQGFIDQHLDKYNRIPTFLDAIEYGIDKIANLMAEKATDAVVHIDAGGYPYIPQIELYDYVKDIPLAKEGDKYKVILIKED